MENKAVLKLVPLETLITLILKTTPDAVDSIISFLYHPKATLVEVRSLHGILKKQTSSTWALLESVKHNPALDSLNQKDLRLFYYGCAQSMLVLSTIRGIYWGLYNNTTEEVPEEVTLQIHYLYKAGNLATDLEIFTKNILLAFRATRTSWPGFGGRVRALMFQTGDGYTKGRYDGIAMLCQKLKSEQPTRHITLSLFGICIQTKWFTGMPFTKESAARNLSDLEKIIQEVSRMKDAEITTMRTATVHHIVQLVRNYRNPS